MKLLSKYNLFNINVNNSVFSEFLEHDSFDNVLAHNGEIYSVTCTAEILWELTTSIDTELRQSTKNDLHKLLTKLNPNSYDLLDFSALTELPNTVQPIK